MARLFETNQYAEPSCIRTKKCYKGNNHKMLELLSETKSMQCIAIWLF